MKYTPHRETPYAGIFKRLIAGTSVFAICLVLVFTFSKTAHAGLLSFVDSIFGSEQASADIPAAAVPQNSQTIPLPSYAVSSVLADDSGISPIDGVDGDFLDPDIAATNSTTTDSLANTDIGTYVVQSGDTIASVAKMFDISSDTIRQSNHLTSSVLKVGQALLILPRSGIIYTVAKGDTLGNIAQRYKVDQDDIVDYNGLTSDVISIGTTIIIPDAQPIAADLAPARPAVVHNAHTVPSYEPLLDDVSKLPWAPAGYYACPVVGKLTQGLHGHNAVDLAAPRGTTIHAAAGGTVIISKSNDAWNGGYGNYVVISHSNGTETLYAHMSKTAVAVGSSVSQGDLIGYVGMTGLTTGPHVHFEVRGARNPFDTVSCQ